MATGGKEILLELDHITVHYGPIRALSGLSINICEGEIVALLGPNGAGKSTLMYTIAGILPITEGQITLSRQPIHVLSVEQIVRLGITLVPEGKLLFGSMKTSENLELGAYHWVGKKKNEEIKRSMSDVFKLFPALKEKEKQAAGALSGGQQQMIAIGRGLMSRPRLLLLDEPSLGLAPILVKQLMGTLGKLREERGLTILLSEQNAMAALSIADRAYVMRGGKVIMEGSGEKLRSTDEIRIAYLGNTV
jgi:branched-chain amino acid transport system ATP-binding protein